MSDATIIDWLIKEYVQATSGSIPEWDQERYDEASRLRDRLEQPPMNGRPYDWATDETGLEQEWHHTKPWRGGGLMGKPKHKDK